MGGGLGRGRSGSREPGSGCCRHLAEAAEAWASVVVQRQGGKSRARVYLKGETLLFSLLLDQGTHVMNFVLILVSVKHALGNRVEMSRKKLDIWFWTSGEKGQCHI